MKIHVLLSFFYIIFSAASAAGFNIPENLQYDLTLGGIKIGNVTLEAKNNASYVELASRVTSVKWVSLFYEVEDGAVSFLTRKSQKDPAKAFAFNPHTYRVKLIEGSNKVNKEFNFDHARKTITYVDHLNNERSYHVLKDATIDPLTSLYYIRHIPLNIGKPVFLNVFNNRLIYKIEVQVLRKETLKTQLGTLKTILIRSNMNAVGDGILYSPGDIYIWLTDDEKKTPVLIEKKLDALVEGKLPDFLKEKMPKFLKEKLSAGSLKAVLVKN